MSKEYLVFANYFNGWWRGETTKWATDGEDWRLRYPERIPIAGCYNGADTMRAEIDYASENGVDCFIMLWYHNAGGKFPDTAALNGGIPDFMNSPNCGKMSFMIEDCNHLPFLTESDEDWERNVSYFVECMKHPSYMRVDGKALLKIHGVYFFAKECGFNAEKAAARIALLRKRARDEGVGELLLCTSAATDEELLPYLKLFDYYSSYAADIPELAKTDEKYPYAYMKDASYQAVEAFKDLRYVPFVMGGWDPSPWKDPRPSFAFPTESEWRDMLLSMKKWLDEKPWLGIPCAEGRQKAFNIYAWNEYGEGGILAPTLGDGDMKLRVLKEVFSEGTKTQTCAANRRAK